MKRTVFAATAILTMLTLAVLMVGVAPVFAQSQAGTTLTATVNVLPHWTKVFGWTIEKSATPSVLDMFRGDSADVAYTITVTKDAGTQTAWVDGQICVTNGGAVATENLVIQAVLQNGYGSPNDFLTSAPVDLSSNPVLDPAEQGCYAYHVDIPFTGGDFPQPHPGGTYKLTAAVTITNHSGSLGTPKGPSPSATTVFPAAPTLVNDNVNVTDTNGLSWLFAASGSQTYSKTFTCDADEGDHYNTATITETGASSLATVDVNCYELTVAKTAVPMFDRKLLWQISKSADTSSLTLSVGQSYPVNYLVIVNKYGFVDANWTVSGEISVNNPAPIGVTLNAVSDVITGVVDPVAVDCGVTFPYVLPAGQTLTCTYASPLPGPNPRLNTAIATIQNTPGGTTDFTGTALIDPSSQPYPNFVDTCVTIDDSFEGGPQDVVYCYDAKTNPVVFSYTRQVGPYEVCGLYTVVNTASFVTNDTATTGSAAVTIPVNVPCKGCTLTIGYWKNHAGFGPQADKLSEHLPVWLGRPDGVKSILVDNAAEAVFLLAMSGEASNGINKLYAQLLAAKLNIANGASGSAVAGTIAAADNFLSTSGSLDWAALTKTKKSQVNSWMSALDKFNNGLSGPGHCTE